MPFWQTNVEHLTEKMKKDVQRGLVLRCVATFSHLFSGVTEWRSYLNYPSKQCLFSTHQEWEVPWFLHHWFYPQAVFIRGEGYLWLQGECVGTSSTGTKPLWSIQQTQSDDKFMLKCLSSREARLRPLTEITAPRWGSGLSSGSPRKWPKISDKVEFWGPPTRNQRRPRQSLIYVSSIPPDHVFANSPDTACVLGLCRKVISFIPVTELKAVTDFE